MKIKSKSKKVNKAWLADHINDPYVKMAQKEGYRARAAYKLKEIDEELKLISPGGAAVGELDGTLIALDILPMDPIEGVQFIQGDFREDAVLQELERVLAGRPLDLVVSDMAPNLSGIESSDSARIAHLVELAVEFSCRHLRPEGALVCKAFHGSGYSQLVELFKDHFRIVKKIKPKASRDRSAETFLVGLHPRSREH